MSSRRVSLTSLTSRRRNHWWFPRRRVVSISTTISVVVVVALLLLAMGNPISAHHGFFGSTRRHTTIRAKTGSSGILSLPQRLRLDPGTELLAPTPPSWLGKSLLTVIPRGGALQDDESDDDGDGDDEYDDESEEDESSFDDDDDDDVTFDFAADEDDALAEADFAEDNYVDRAVAAWKKTPPLTKSYLTASAAATLYGYAFCDNDFPKVLLLDWNKVLTRLQIWRPFTSFLNFGPFGLGFLMTAQFVWAYMSTLERLNYSRPYDFWIMVVFGMLAMVVGYPIFNKLIPGFNLSPRFLGHNLSTFLVYIWSRYHEGIEVNMFELFTTRAELLPWFFLAQTFLLEGEPPVLDFLGIVFGHIYHHCKTLGILRAPAALTAWYEEGESAKRIREKYKTISSDFEVVE